MNFDTSFTAAQEMDKQDSLKDFRNEFIFPSNNPLYFCGHSLGLASKKARQYVADELTNWGHLGVQGHFQSDRPWFSYHELLTEYMAEIVGALPKEVVLMNSLTVNLHLALVSFYKPDKHRFKILIEDNVFPSDIHALASHARWHGMNPEEVIVSLSPQAKGMDIDPEDILQTIDDLGNSLALVLLGNCNFLTGQAFLMEKITQKAHQVGASAGFDLAHGAGNLLMELHDWQVDFAVWCSYKYLNSGPGGPGGLFIHEKHLNKSLPRFEGWWGHDKKTRFKMDSVFKPIPTVEAWQLSNPSIFHMASLLGSLEIFHNAGMKRLRQKGDKLTNYLLFLLKKSDLKLGKIITPKDRGSMICLKLTKDCSKLMKFISKKGVLCDFREPDILRITPCPLYNSFCDIHRLIEMIRDFDET